MRNTPKVKNFIKKWQNNSLGCKEVLYDYKSICKNLLYENEDEVLKTIDILKKNIRCWAQENCFVYKNFKENYIEKKHLLEKKDWYVDKVKSQNMATNGSITGEKFDYLRWDEFLNFIECDNHYDLILEEFNIKSDFKILFFLDIGLQFKKNKPIKIKNFTNNFMEKHGIKRTPEIYYVNFNLYKNKKEIIFEEIIKNIQNNQPFDVVLTSGPNVNSLCNYLKNNKINIKIANLLSNTNEKLLESSIFYIKENNIFDNICDHMRCWDGGATFFTCKHENYHLLDNLSWCVEDEGKLISTDYFSLASPFVEYWNGDYCKIDSKYQKCDCGRLYRDFEFLENRPFLIKGKNILEIQSAVKDFNQIREIRCSKDSLEIVSDINISTNEQKTIKEIVNKVLNNDEDELLKISFFVEKIW